MGILNRNGLILNAYHSPVFPQDSTFEKQFRIQVLYKRLDNWRPKGSYLKTSWKTNNHLSTYNAFKRGVNPFVPNAPFIYPPENIKKS